MLKLVLVSILSILLSGILGQSVITNDDGLEVAEGNYRWSTYIEVLNNDTLEFVSDCFGVVISQSWIFTSAQCGTATNNIYRLHFGGVNFTNSESMIATNYIIHPNYDPMIDCGLYNVGLILLPSPIDYNYDIPSVTLPWELVGMDLTGMLVHFLGRRHILNEGKIF